MRFLSWLQVDIGCCIVAEIVRPIGYSTRAARLIACGFVTKAAFRDAIVGARVETGAAVLFAILIRHDHHRQRLQLRIALD
ncbi:hypothetical protein [Paraburkholderia ribeironis]|uniref:hypothetical protein n=1 Tax=Paraburkholderia ribeironis TaxID=1247936 RepID=UPI0013564E01|nr:hypothetical protein [Paraburkholderia ribeironis]